MEGSGSTVYLHEISFLVWLLVYQIYTSKTVPERDPKLALNCFHVRAGLCLFSVTLRSVIPFV